MTARRAFVIAALAFVWGLAVGVLILTSDHEDAKAIWVVFGPAVLWSFVGTGLYAWLRLPESRAGRLMVLLGFAWGVSGLGFANNALIYTIGEVFGGLWGGVFLQLVMSFPSGRLAPGRDRAIVIAGYVLFTIGIVPALMFTGTEQLDCPQCPDYVFLVRPDDALSSLFHGILIALYAVLFVITLTRLAKRWQQTRPLERLQLTPVYTCGMLTFLLVTIGAATGSDALQWSAFIATSLLPFAFLGGLLRNHVAQLDEALRARLEELRASRARLVAAGDAERRRLERDLHDGAQSRLVALALLLGQARRHVGDDSGAAPLLDRAQEELTTSLAELRELARGIHPAVLTERGLEPALSALAARAPVPVTIHECAGERLPGPVESAAYFVVSEALTNVAKYAEATQASVAVRRSDGHVTVEVADDGKGGADADRGSGLRGLADRVAALEGTLSLDSPPGDGTRLRAVIPC